MGRPITTTDKTALHVHVKNITQNLTAILTRAGEQQYVRDMANHCLRRLRELDSLHQQLCDVAPVPVERFEALERAAATYTPPNPEANLHDAQHALELLLGNHGDILQHREDAAVVRELVRYNTGTPHGRIVELLRALQAPQVLLDLCATMQDQIWHAVAREAEVEEEVIDHG